MSGEKSWTEEDTALAVKLWTSGHSAAVISAELYSRHSRNSVLGKMHRMKVLRPGYMPRPRDKKVRTEARYTPKRKAAFREPPVVEDIHARQAEAPPAEAVTLLELEECMCRWPVGNARYCGRVVPRRVAYCEEHAEVSRRKYT